MELLVKLCTSPVRSSYTEAIAQNLAREVRARGKPFNTPAGGYAVDLARGLGLISQQNTWTDKGHLLALVADVGNGPWEAELELTPRERLAHLRLFLEGDGAALLYIARHLIQHKRIPNTDDDWNNLAQELFVGIYSECLTLTGTTADRVALRMEIDRIRTRGYTGKSGPHKVFIHLQTLYRLGLIERGPSSAAREYRLPEGDAAQGLQSLVAEIHDLYALEVLIKEHRALDVAAKVCYAPATLAHREWTLNDVLRLVIPVYQKIMATGVPLCPLPTAIEATQIRVLAHRFEWLPYAVALDLIQRAQREHIGQVRFHVDRRGEPAFLKFGDELLAAYSLE